MRKGAIRWTGRNTQGSRKWELFSDTMLELYKDLLSCGVINENDYDPYQKAKIEKEGYDYHEFMAEFDFEEDSEWERFQNVINGYSDLTEDEIKDLIESQNGNAYYQTFQHLFVGTYQGKDFDIYAEDESDAIEKTKSEAEAEFDVFANGIQDCEITIEKI